MRAALLIGLAACHHDLAETDAAFYNWDARRMHCAIDIDTSTLNELPSIETALDRAAARGEVIELFAHRPGSTISMAELDAVLSAIDARGLAYFTYADFAHGTGSGAGVALALDDANVTEWLACREMFATHGARVTFFVSTYPNMSAEQRAGIRTLADDGHAIEPHSVNHRRAPEMVEQVGLAAYLRDEVDPSIDALRADGYDVTTYAQPFGSRTHEIDVALFKRVQLVRSVAFAWSGVTDPCPD